MREEFPEDQRFDIPEDLRIWRLFGVPEDRSIWRYMDFAKYVDLISTKKLFFPKAKHLGDAWEGSWTRDVVLHAVTSGGMTIARIQEWTTRLRETTCVSSWHMSDHESPAMWKLYSLSNQAIAVRSDIASLRTSITPRPNLQLLFGGVQYDPPENGCSLESTFFYKRKPFEHEKEFRVVVLHVDTERPGLYVEINEIEQFIKEVCVAPTAPDWFRELTRRVTADYGFYWDVKTSDLDAIPLSDPHV